MKIRANTIAVAIIAVVGMVVAMRIKADFKNTIYDPNPSHPWNRLNETLFMRTAQDGKNYGIDELDILYWHRTTNLLAGTSHQRAVSALDEFIQSHGEKSIRDPLKRAWLQRDLWELFDWLARPWPDAAYATQRKELQSRLALIIRRLALTTNEIVTLPDNYALADKSKSPDLPRGLFETNGDWVNLAPDLYGNQEIAPAHDHSFDGHSAFLVMVHLPEGRQATFSYLETLRSFEHFWVYVTNTSPFVATNSPPEILAVNSCLPEFPTNTEWAIVRRMLLVDADGNLQPTPITESIQMRRYQGFSLKPRMVATTNSNGYRETIFIPPQRLYEFQMNRRQNGALREIAPDEKDFLHVHFLGQGIDPFERKSEEPAMRDSSNFKSTILNDCETCHQGPGIYSVNVYAGTFHPRNIEFPELYEMDINREMTTAINWKQEQFSWGLLQGLWNQAN